jgi:hypothetical protein
MRHRLVSMLVVALTAIASFAIAPTPPASAFSSVVSSVDFGNVAVGHKRWVAIPITLDAGYSIQILQWTNPSLFDIDFNPCGFVHGLITCDIRAAFKPAAPGLQTSTLTVTEFNGATQQNVVVSLSGTGASSVPGKAAAHFSTNLMRGVASTSFGDSGFTLDAFGGLHTYAMTGVQAPPAPHGGPYWPGWGIARGVALLSNDTGGYVLDGYGGLHPFGVGGHAAPPAAQHFAYWPGLDIARGVTLTEDGTGGYVVDAYGGLHRFTVGAHALPPAPTGGPYWPGLNIVRGVTLGPVGGGYVLDAYGGTHFFKTNGVSPPVLHGTPYWPGFDIARGIDYTGAWGRVAVIDGYGGLHLSTPALSVSSLPAQGNGALAVARQ